jgi:tetratricopeptide (TPR) repeat protein
MNPQIAFLLSKAMESIQASKFPTAQLFLCQALKLQPRNPEVLRLKGVLAALNDDYEGALIYLEKVLEISPKFATALSNTGNVYLKLGRHEEALACYNKAIANQPNDHETHNNKGNLLQEQKKYGEAITSYDKAILLNPNYYEAYTNKANALKELKRLDEALANYKKSISINPSYSPAWSGIGWVFHVLKSYDEAEYYLRKSIDLDPNHAHAQEHLAHMYLKVFRFSEGWSLNESRWKVDGLKTMNLCSKKPRWQKANVKTLLVWAEQGIGDQILYSSMLNDLAEFPQRKIVSLDKKLLDVFRRSFPSYEFINKETVVPEEMYDEHIPIGSLGGILRNSLECFQRARYPYIFDDAIRTQSIKSRPEFANKVTCGISWGSINKKLGDDKSIPIQDLYPILKMSDIEFVNLQYGNIKSTLIRVKEEIGKQIINLDEVDLLEDVDGALSIISACDIIVTSSNSTAHLAGALGKETLLLVPYSVGQFWYWHAVDGKSIWYPSVKVFEQAQQGDWSAPVNAVKKYLESRFG